MKYLSLFSGIGGFELGIKQAYEKLYNSSDNTRELQAERELLSKREDIESKDSEMPINCSKPSTVVSCIGFSEIDKYATQIYKKHFNHKEYGDITKINEKELPDFELIVGGFPCQSFSIAGKRGGFEDTRGTMFFEIARIIREKQPRLLLLENVKGLLSHDKGETFTTIISTLDELGYDIQWQVLNSKNFGVPQNRERVFIIGHLRGTSRPEVFPITGTNTATTFSNTIRTGGKGSLSKKHAWDLIQLNKPKHSNDRVYSDEGLSPTLNTMQGGNRQPFVAPVLTPDRPNKRQNGRRFKENGEPSFTLTAQDRHGVFIRNPYNGKTSTEETGTLGTSCGTSTGMTAQHLYKDSKIRRLTPKECERLQGFPDDWTEGVSDTQRYKQCGNAVSVPVVKAIMEKLL